MQKIELYAYLKQYADARSRFKQLFENNPAINQLRKIYHGLGSLQAHEELSENSILEIIKLANKPCKHALTCSLLQQISHQLFLEQSLKTGEGDTFKHWLTHELKLDTEQINQVLALINHTERLELAKLLSQVETADVHQCILNAMGSRIVHRLLDNRAPELAEIFLKQGVDIYCKDGTSTIIERAARHEYGPTHIFTWLLNYDRGTTLQRTLLVHDLLMRADYVKTLRLMIHSVDFDLSDQQHRCVLSHAFIGFNLFLTLKTESEFFQGLDVILQGAKKTASFNFKAKQNQLDFCYFLQRCVAAFELQKFGQQIKPPLLAVITELIIVHDLDTTMPMASQLETPMTIYEFLQEADKEFAGQVLDIEENKKIMRYQRSAETSINFFTKIEPQSLIALEKQKYVCSPESSCEFSFTR